MRHQHRGVIVGILALSFALTAYNQQIVVNSRPATDGLLLSLDHSAPWSNQ